ncbi:MAG TPA: hypothetical protein VH305_06280 [Gaiella sp.]|jgi:hypothetical protein
MGLLRTGYVATATTLAVLALAGGAVADAGDTVRGGGVELDVPDGWARVQPARQAPDADPRTVVVIGTEGVRAVDTPCQVSTYAVPEDGAVVVVVGWREPTGVSSFLPLSGLKLRRGMFQCFADRGAVAQVTRRGLDYQVNVMVGDRASAETVDAALAAARSIAAAQRRHD